MNNVRSGTDNESIRDDPTAQLTERVKELSCLYEIAKVSVDPALSFDQVIQGIVNHLPPAWQFPDHASARISIEDKVYKSLPYHRGRKRQRTNISVNGQPIGFVEVSYRETAPVCTDHPFLNEEHKLLELVARHISLVVERWQTLKEKRSLQNQLIHADRLATIGLLSAGIAHELNEPLGNILGFAQLIRKNPDLSQAVIQDILKIENSSLHAREIIRKLLVFSRQTPSNMTKLRLNDVVTYNLTFFESRCAKSGIDVVKELEAQLPEITADESQLAQVVVNLVVNAIQAMENGGTLSIKTGHDENHVVLTISDNGTGMDEATRKKIFLPFFTTKDVGQGTGLGLSVVHGIVSSHGGSIRVQSKLGSGATFEVRFPRSAKEIVRSCEDTRNSLP